MKKLYELELSVVKIEENGDFAEVTAKDKAHDSLRTTFTFSDYLEEVPELKLGAKMRLTVEVEET